MERGKTSTERVMGQQDGCAHDLGHGMTVSLGLKAVGSVTWRGKLSVWLTCTCVGSYVRAQPRAVQAAGLSSRSRDVPDGQRPDAQREVSPAPGWGEGGARVLASGASCVRRRPPEDAVAILLLTGPWLGGRENRRSWIHRACGFCRLPSSGSLDQSSGQMRPPRALRCAVAP
eukprot:1115150-Rhodomonas_salina.1